MLIGEQAAGGLNSGDRDRLIRSGSRCVDGLGDQVIRKRRESTGGHLVGQGLETRAGDGGPGELRAGSCSAGESTRSSKVKNKTLCLHAEHKKCLKK